MKLRFDFVVPFIILILMLVACDSDTFYDESLAIPKEGWPASSPAYFNVDVDDTLTYNTLFMRVSNNVNYKYQNIYFFVTVVFPDGRMARDTVNFDLANNYGEWYGKGIGSVKTLQLPYRSRMIFPFSGTYKFYIEQAMRDDTLKNVTAIGLKIKEEK